VGTTNTSTLDPARKRNPKPKEETMAKSQEKLLPTPPIGYRVRWRDVGGKFVAPADVIEIDDYLPGVLILSVNRGNRLVRVDTVHWENHPDMNGADKTGAAARGTWAYLSDEKIPPAHYDLDRRTKRLTEENKKKQLEYIKEQTEIREAAASEPIDPIAVEVARIKANAILNG